MLFNSIANIALYAGLSQFYLLYRINKKWFSTIVTLLLCQENQSIFWYTSQHCGKSDLLSQLLRELKISVSTAQQNKYFVHKWLSTACTNTMTVPQRIARIQILTCGSIRPFQLQLLAPLLPPKIVQTNTLFEEHAVKPPRYCMERFSIPTFQHHSAERNWVMAKRLVWVCQRNCKSLKSKDRKSLRS